MRSGSDSEQGAQATERKSLQVHQPQYPLHGATAFPEGQVLKKDSPSCVGRHLTQSVYICESGKRARIFI